MEAIRTRYEEKDSRETKLEQLRKLDGKARAISMTAALVLGIGGMLIFGTGMSLVLVWNFQVPGILVGILGLALMAAAYLRSWNSAKSCWSVFEKRRDNKKYFTNQNPLL